MKPVHSHIWASWFSGGPFIGDKAVHGVVTFEPSAWLQTFSCGGVGAGNTQTQNSWLDFISSQQSGVQGVLEASHENNNPSRYASSDRGMKGDDSDIAALNSGPFRWFQHRDYNGAEFVIPNVRTIQIERSMDGTAGTCTISIRNITMKKNEDDYEFIGFPGLLRFDLTAHPEATARWGPQRTEHVITLNTLIRTYQGFGGREKSLDQAIEDGNLTQTGVWIVDDVELATGGPTITLKCRDTGKLLIEQQLFPPLIPTALYPLKFCTDRESYSTDSSQGGYVPGGSGSFLPPNTTSASQADIEQWIQANTLFGMVNKDWLSSRSWEILTQTNGVEIKGAKYVVPRFIGTTRSFLGIPESHRHTLQQMALDGNAVWVTINAATALEAGVRSVRKI